MNYAARLAPHGSYLILVHATLYQTELAHASDVATKLLIRDISLDEYADHFEIETSMRVMLRMYFITGEQK